ncbi:hypothetical protein OJ997_04035 [Solirubrobacter phytolaccae]|uniref:Secreted protein n=1 Tax=Solirubrobacter phytolaccae TaxID=1404360 RepID=A0A9X3N6Z4_9ACTN|nr:hypothetical protein [Solirubrobacter phytolaccae]MDA0179454.1 hypothetical protein [Solirubrobacter phytolaccae]
MFRVCLVLSLAVLGLITASASAATTVMACGSKYRQHPSSCVVGSDGSTAGTARLSSLRWTGWSKNTATAKGRQSANHRERDGSLPRYRTTVQVSGLDFCDGRSYYTQIRFKTSWPDTRARYSEWLSLRTPCS